MQLSPRHLEGVARQLLEEVELDAPIDAFELAGACGLVLKPWGKAHAQLDLATGVIRYPAKARHGRAQFRVGHEIAHAVLRRARESDEDEADVDYLASALLLPRAAFLADLDATEWDLFAMHERHPNASYQAIAVRMAQLSPATVSIWDAGALHVEYNGADVAGDHLVADRVLELGVPVRGVVDGWPIFSPGFRRVVCIRRAA